MACFITLGLLFLGNIMMTYAGDSPFGMTTCEPDSCAPAATCTQYDGYISCICPEGKTGINCTIDDPCVPRSECPSGQKCFGTCNPNFQCMAPIGFQQCSGCVTGYTGSLCQKDRDECVDTPEPCNNNGTCVNTVGSYTCTCPHGWVGKLCACKSGTSCDTVTDDNPGGGASSISFHLTWLLTASSVLHFVF